MNVRNPLNGRTPLAEAMTSRRTENVRLLIASGADMNTRDSLGLTPMISAAMNQMYDLVYDMLVAGADPTMDIPKSNGKTVLTIIRKSRALPGTPPYESRQRVIELLKQKGFDVEHGD